MTTNVLEFTPVADLDDDEPTQQIDTEPIRLTLEQQRERAPEYPYGRRADGSPKGKPGPRGNGEPRMAAAPKPRKNTAAKPAPKKAEPDFRPGIMGLLQIPTLALSVIGRQTKNATLQADGMALAIHAPALAEALNATAKQQPAVARALESIMKAGPYGAIIAATVPLVMQLAANHHVINPAPAMGIHDPADLVEQSNAQLAAMAGGVAA